MKSSHNLTCTSVAIAGLLAASQSLADPNASVAPAPDPALEEVVVTAQKRSESVQSMAAAITAISGASLEERGINNVNELQFLEPSFRSGTLSGSTDIAIRGIGVGAGSSPGVAVNVDGVYQPQTFTADLAQIDLQRVEVLRGPQGTLYGRNATGGAVNFLTNAPTDSFESSLLAGYASYDEYHLQGIVNAPLNDSVRTRLMVDYDDREDGFVKNVDPVGPDLDKGKTLSGRFRLSADLTSKLVFDLGISAVHSTGPFEYAVNSSTPSAAVLAIDPVLAKATFITTPWRTNVLDPAGYDRDYQSVSGTFTWQLPFGTLKSITAFQNYLTSSYLDGAGTNISIAPDVGRTHDQTRTQEFDLSGSWQRLDWVAGLFYMSETDITSLVYTFPQSLSGLPPDSYLDFEQPRYDTKSYAGFADGTFHILDALKLIAGMRYSEDRETATYSSSLGLLIDDQEVPLAALCPQETDRLKFPSFTPRAGLQYDVDPAMNAYFIYSKGFKAGGANVESCGDDYKPEHITSYEGGLKSRWLDNSITLNLSVFHYNYKDLQVTEIVDLSSEVTNAAAAKVDGVEIESAWAPNSHWTLNGNFSYINAVYVNFSNTDSLNSQLGVQNLDGHLLDNSPRESGSVGVAYRTDPLSFGRLTGRLDASYSSRVYFREFNEPLDSQAPYGLVNLTLVWDSPDQKYTARIRGTNLTDTAYAENMGSTATIGTRYITWGAPRQVGAEIKVRF